MTETDKAREIALQIHHANPAAKGRRHIDCEAKVAHMIPIIEAYGAAQYEAGAAQMRERAAQYSETHYTLFCETPTVHIADCPQSNLVPLANAVRALPLREKD